MNEPLPPADVEWKTVCGCPGNGARRGCQAAPDPIKALRKDYGLSSTPLLLLL